MRLILKATAHQLLPNLVVNAADQRLLAVERRAVVARLALCAEDALAADADIALAIARSAVEEPHVIQTRRSVVVV